MAGARAPAVFFQLSLGSARPMMTVMLSLPPPSRASCSRSSHACLAEINDCKLLEFRWFRCPLWIRRVLVRAQEGQCPR